MRLKDSTEELQCNVEVVVAPSYIKKFRNNVWSLLEDICTQFTLLNKIFQKVALERKKTPFHLTLNIETVIIYSDEAHSPFKSDGDLEHFTKSHQHTKQYCLTIGLVNQHLRSGQLFDGYIPEGGGGVCTHGDTLLVSHGNEESPAPMALFFAALMRGITRALGANDKDEKCDVGSNPNPMRVLKDYLLAKGQITPDKGYSIFTTCNVQEIESALTKKECLIKVNNPFCGNGIVEKGEECDCGPDHLCHQLDPCCNPPHPPSKSNTSKDMKSHEKGCTLKKGYKCSMSQECCSRCREFKANGTCISGPGVCDIGVCDGKSAKCPTGVRASNGQVCSKYRKLADPLICKNMKCETSLCASFGLKPCSCAAYTGHECSYCCEKGGECKAAGKQLKLIEGRDLFLPDSENCTGGTCMQGKCSYAFGYAGDPSAEVSGSSSWPLISIITSTQICILFLVLFLDDIDE